MAINIVARKTVRAQLATLIQAAATAGGLTANVLGYAPKTVDSSVATVSVTSASSARELVLADTHDNAYDLDVWIYVPRTGTGQTEEDAVDDLEKIISAVVEDNPVLASYWTDLAMREKTQAIYVLIGGMQYRAELVPVTVQPQVL